MPNKKAEDLLKRYKDGTATDQEIAKLFLWIQRYEEVDQVNFSSEELERVQQELAARLPALVVEPKRRALWPRYAAAASIIFILFIGLYVIFRENTSTYVAKKEEVKDIAPGVNQATLTLSNGKKIVLTENMEGQIAQEGDVSINVGKQSAVEYVSGAGEPGKPAYNTLTTLRGEQSPFPLVLSDGTKVWLNSASSLIFPARFSGDKREVQLYGEAYFEVVHNDKKPFIVRSGNQVVQDIGTSFNISSYGDDPEIKTTLVEGAASVHAYGITRILSPGRQAKVSQGNITVGHVDTKSEIAWLQGKFIFQDEELHSVMRKLSRWYNINVTYNNEPKNAVLGGSFSKDRSISNVLKALEQTGLVKFKIQGNTVTVTQ